MALEDVTPAPTIQPTSVKAEPVASGARPKLVVLFVAMAASQKTRCEYTIPENR